MIYSQYDNGNPFFSHMWMDSDSEILEISLNTLYYMTGYDPIYAWDIFKAQIHIIIKIKWYALCARYVSFSPPLPIQYLRFTLNAHVLYVPEVVTHFI